MPIMARGASSRQRPPDSRTSASRAAFHSGSESMRTPSRSKITAAGVMAGASGVGRDPQDDVALGALGGIEDDVQLLLAQLLGRLDDDDQWLGPGARAVDHAADVLGLARERLR